MSHGSALSVGDWAGGVCAAAAETQSEAASAASSRCLKAFDIALTPGGLGVRRALRGNVL